MFIYLTREFVKILFELMLSGQQAVKDKEIVLKIRETEREI
jgi:hypothetical protein